MSFGDTLVLCSGTLAEDTPFETLAAAAADAGFAAISMWGRDHGRARAEGLSDNDIRAVLRDHGLAVAYLDPAWWWPPGAAEVLIPPEADALNLFAYGEREMFAIAEELQASSILAIDAFGGTWTMEEAADAFGSFCDRAAHTGLAVHLEFLPWSRIPDLATAWDIVRRAGRPNAGIALDAWHFHRSHPDLDLLRTLTEAQITAVILDDAPLEPAGELLDEAMHRRLLPGAGELDLAALIDVLHDIDVDAPVGVEVLSDRFHDHDPAHAAHLAAEATRAILSRAAER